MKVNFNIDNIFPLLAGFAALVVFAPAVGFEFVNFDDSGYVTNNPLVLTGLSPELLRAAFTTFIMDNWHPLTILSLALDVQLFGPSSAAMHAVNILIHAGNVAFVCILFQKMTSHRWLPFVLALIYGLHPLRIESVAWISERKDVLSTFFWLATTLSYISYARSKPSICKYALVLGLFGLGLLTKPMLVTLPFALLLLDFWPLNRFGHGVWRGDKVEKNNHRPPFVVLGEKIPLLALSLLVSMVCYRSQVNALAPQEYGIVTAILRAGSGVMEYLAKTFFPVNLAAFYPPAVEGYLNFKNAAKLAVILGVTIWIFMRRHHRPWLAVGWAWFLGTLVPVIGLVQVGQQAFADRYTYIPHVGLLIAVLGETTAFWAAKIVLTRSLAIAAIIGLSVLCSLHLQTWRNSLSLWQNAMATQSDHYVIRKNLAMAYVQSGSVSAAVPHMKSALELGPSAIVGRRDLSELLVSIDEFNDAETQIRLVLETAPDWRDARESLAIIQEFKEDFGASCTNWQELHSIEPTLASGIGLAICAAQSGNNGSAAERLNEVEQKSPQWRQVMFASAWNSATTSISVARNPPAAVIAAARLCRLDPGNPQLLDLLATAYASAGNFDRAVQHARAAIERAQSNADYHDLVAVLNERLHLFLAGKPFFQTDV